MNIMIRGITIAVLLGGGGLGLTGEAQANCSAVTPELRNMYLPWICAIARQSPSTASTTETETVTWRVTFSEPIKKPGGTEFDFDETTASVSGGGSTTHSPSGCPCYGTGSSTAAFTKVGDGSSWDISFTWDCMSSNNDCQHNTGGDHHSATQPATVGTTRYQGTVGLVLSGSGAWQRTNSSNTGTQTHANVIENDTFNVQ